MAPHHRHSQSWRSFLCLQHMRHPFRLHGKHLRTAPLRGFPKRKKGTGNPKIPAPFARDAGAIIKLMRYPYHQTKNKSRTKLSPNDKNKIRISCSVHMRSSKLRRRRASSGNVAHHIPVNKNSRSFQPDQPARSPGPAPYPMITFGTRSVIDLISQRSLF